MRAAPSSPLFPRSYTATPTCDRIVTPQRTQLYSMAHRTPSSVRVQCSRVIPATVGEQVPVQLPQPLRAAVDVRPTARLAGVAVSFEGLHDAFQFTFRQSPLVVA